MNRILLNACLLVLGIALLPMFALAQPNYLATGLSSSWQYHALADLGNVRQVTVSAGCAGGSCNEWAFLVNNNFGTCGAPSCAVWRPYSAGSAAVPFNSVIVPNGGSNYGALYNNGSSGGNQGNPGYFAAPTVGRHYTFNITENASADNTFEVLETTFFPTSLTGANTTTSGGNVSITGLPTLNSGENLFLRYSSSPTMATSSLIQLTPSGGAASVNLPVNCSGTTVYYYFYTSSKTSGSILADVGSYGEIAHELSTLRVLMPTLGSYYSISYGGPVVVTSSAGTTTTATTYTDLGAAATAINGTTHEGVITVDINGTHPTVTSTISFTHDANNTSILIRPSCGAVRTISGNIAGQLIFLNGADNVTFDGLNTGGNGLIIENMNSTGTANVSTIQLNNDAQNTTIRNCEIMGSSTIAAQGVISVIGGGTNGSDNLLIENNKIHQSGTNLPTNGIYLTGTAGTVSHDNLTIQNNEIYNFNITSGTLTGGIAGSANLHNVTIQNNHFYATQTLTNTTSGNELRAIMVSAATSDGINILNNYIGGSTTNAGGTPLTLPEGTIRLIRMTVGTTVPSLIQGNTIRNVSLTTTSAATAMSIINVVTGRANILDNTIGSVTTNGSITINSNGTAGMVFSGISVGTGTADDMTISNNTIAGVILGGTNTNSTNTIAFRGISLFNGTANAKTYTVTNNKIGSPTQNASLQTTLPYATVTGIFSSTTNAMTHYINNNRIFNLSTILKVNGIELTGNGPNYNINNNRIEGLSASASGGIIMTGIISAVSTPSVSHIISGDTIANFSMAGLTGNCFGITIPSGVGNYTISANRIYDIVGNSNISAPTVTIAGINCLATGVAQTISRNTIYALQNTDPSSASTIVGINFSTSAGSTNNVSGNFIHSLTLNTTNTSGQILGIMHPFTNAGTTRLDNNMVRLGIDKDGNAITRGYGITGIRDAAGTNSYYYNSVLIAGTGVNAGSYTAAFAALATLTANVRDVKNNLFINTRSHSTTNPTIRHYAISVLNKSSLSINYNGYYTNGIDGIIGNYGLPTPLDVPTLCEWRTAMIGAGGADANSIWGEPFFVNGNGNATTVDLHIDVLSSTPIEGKGVNIPSIVTDYDFATRNATTPDIGADEGAFTAFNYVVSINLDSVNSICEGSTSFNLTYNTPIGSPNKYSLTSSDMAGFVTVTDAALPSATIPVTIPSGIAAGVYHFTLTVKNYEYCVSQSYPFSLTIAPQPNLVITNPAAVCSPNTVNLTASAVTAGSTLPSGSTLSYWTNVGATLPLASPGAVGVGGVYYIKATKGQCYDIKPVTVTINPSPVLLVTDPSPICSPNTVDITDPSVTAGSTLGGATLSYWTNAGATNSLTTPAAVAVDGVYYIKATSASGCTDIEAVTVSINPSPNLVITNPSAVCSPNTINITAASVTAGSTLSGAALSYWTNSLATNALATPSAVATSGTYYIKAATGAGCIDIQPVVVTINPSPNLVITNPSAVCSPTTINITAASVTAGSTLSGATLSYWTNAGATTALSTPNAVATSGTYYIKAETGTGCVDIQPVVVTINPSPNLVITNPTAVCSPNTIDITAASVTAGSTLSGAMLSYWTNAGATTALTTPSAVATSGTYYIKAETGAGCIDIQPVVVTINPSPNLVITNPSAVCSPNTIDITAASVTAGSTLSGATLSYWTNVAATTALSTPNAVATSGTYYIKAATGAGCTDIQPVVVTINPSPNLVITNPSAVCSPNTINLTAASVTAGSTLSGATLSYWTNVAATTTLSTPNAVATSGTYYIKAETGAGCIDIQPVVVTINLSPAMPTTSDKCGYGASLTLTATGSGGTLKWYNNNTASGTALATGATYNAITSGTYYVFEENGIGCLSAGASAMATLRTGASTNIPTVAGDYWATDVVQEGTWTHYCRCADDYRILSLELNGQNIGANLVPTPVATGNASNQYGVRLHIASGTTVYVPNTVPYIDLTLAPNGWWLIPRAWDVFPHTQPSSAVGVRSYYTIADYNNLNTDITNGGGIPLTSHTQLTMYKLLGLEAAPKLDAAHLNVTQPEIKLYANLPYYTPWASANLAPSNPNVYYGEYDVASFSGGGGGGGSNGNPPFPIVLLSFTGKAQAAQNILDWVTASEFNAAYFDVEHSIDGISFEKMGQVTAKGFSTEHTSYTFTDKYPYQGKNLYRLKMIDNDGAFRYSQVIEITNHINFALNLYPNPAKEELQLSLNGVEGNLTFKLYNALGELVMHEKRYHTVGTTEKMSLKGITQGVYQYQVIYKGETIRGKLVVE